MTQGKREEHPSRKPVEITRVSEGMQRQNDKGQEGGTSKQKMLRDHKGEQKHSKAKRQRARGRNIQAENGKKSQG